MTPDEAADLAARTRDAIDTDPEMAERIHRLLTDPLPAPDPEAYTAWLRSRARHYGVTP